MCSPESTCVSHLVIEITAGTYKMIGIYKNARIFGRKGSISRICTDNLFSDLVKRPTNGGSKKDKSLEMRDLISSKGFLHNWPCKTDEERSDYAEFGVFDVKKYIIIFF